MQLMNYLSNQKFLVISHMIHKKNHSIQSDGLLTNHFLHLIKLITTTCVNIKTK